jgi:hypothetical protein
LTPARHQFGSVQITLMLNWVLSGIPLRATCNALAQMHEIGVDWGFDLPVPHFTTVRSWLLRLGYHNLNRLKEHAEDWIWVVDHSNQIGQERCLLILGVRGAQLPAPGEDFPLRLAQMEPIELDPVVVSDRQTVYRQLKANAAKTGVPRAIISDHGCDLAGGIEFFRADHPEVLDIYDITHKAACLLKARLERDEQWKAFAAQAGRTKCRIQQTEWSFLVPPAPRLKARYMNLGELIGWGKKTLALLDDPGPEVLRHGTVARLNEKLGWLGQYRAALVRWSEMEQVIDVAVDFVRTEGLYRGAGKALRRRLQPLRAGPAATDLGRDLARFVTAQSCRLRCGERLPGSSEVIESCFGKFKALEREQSKGGFTSLVLALAACVSERTKEVVHEALQSSRTQQMRDWIKTKLGDTLGSKRRIAYRAREAETASRSETKPKGSPALALP